MEQLPAVYNRDRLVAEAFAHHQGGRFEQARAIYQQVLEQLPNDFVSLHMLGVLFHQCGELHRAEEILSKAVVLGELTPEVHYNLANVYLAQGKRDLAQGRFLRALELNKDFVLAKQQLSAMGIDVARLKSGKEKGKTGKHKDHKAAKRVARQPTAQLLQQAVQAQERGNLPDAIEKFQKVLAQSPREWTALFSLGRLLILGGNPAEGLKLIDRQIAVNPTYAPGHQMRATALDMLGRYEEAISAVDDGIRLDPNDFEALNRKVVILIKIDCAEEAIRLLEVALEIKPKHPQTLSNLGTILSATLRYADAVKIYKRLIAVEPMHLFAKGALMYSRMHIADWTDFAQDREKICEQVLAGHAVCLSLPMFSVSNNASEHLRCSQIFGERYFRKAQTRLWRGERYQHDRIRVAFVSADFREHPVGHLLAGVIERLDKNKFELIGVSAGIDDASILRERFKTAFDHFTDVRTLSDLDLGKLVRSLEPDIAVDLAGFTQGAKTQLFIDRVAPTQVNYLGFPGSMGLDCMDYIIADPHTIPVDDEVMFTENVAWLPDTYLPTDANLVVSEETPSRQACGLPEVGFVFCSFNHIFKLNPIIFDCWMRILKAVPDSVLWLSKPSPEAIENLRKNAEECGVSADRLIFAGRVPKVADHLARYRNAGLFLDTLPYNAHTTAADALFVGLPVLTCTGGAFPGRVATGLLHALGVPELACKSLEEYEQTAIALANDSERLTLLREKVVSNRSKTPLFDTDLYTRNLEAAFQMMVDRQKAGLAPASFRVGEAMPIPGPASAR